MKSRGSGVASNSCWRKSVSHKETKVLGQCSVSIDQSALTHPMARSQLRDPSILSSPLPHPCSPPAVCGPALPPSPVPAK